VLIAIFIVKFNRSRVISVIVIFQAWTMLTTIRQLYPRTFSKNLTGINLLS